MHFPDKLYSAFERTGLTRLLPAEPAVQEEPPLRGHIIVVGMNSLGRRLVTAFADREETVVAIDTDPAKLSGLPGRHVVGSTDYHSVLESAQFGDAKLVVSALQIEDANTLLTYRAKMASVATGMHAFDSSVVPELQAIGADYLMVSKHDGIRQVAAELRRLGVID
jgi:Trk K+ transport system NAD-binding subunit